jgi:hypothetical protein
MKRFLLFLCAVVLTFGISAPANALVIDYVDVGNPISEAGHNLTSWGPIWNMEDPGFFGNWGGGPPAGDKTWRLISTIDTGDSAFIYLDFGSGASMSAVHLEGIALDSFEIKDVDTGNILFTYGGDTNTAEEWMTSEFEVMLTGKRQIEFISTAGHWSGYNTYGQVAISSITVQSIPDATALVLLSSAMIGACLFGRKKVFRKELKK